MSGNLHFFKLFQHLPHFSSGVTHFRKRHGDEGRAVKPLYL